MELYQQIIISLAKQRDDLRAASMSAYMRNQFSYLGIGSPNRKKILRPFVPQFRKLDEAERRRQTILIWDQEEREYQYVAIDLWIGCKNKMTPADHKVIHRMLTTYQWWDTIDLLASHMIGHLWKKYPDLKAQHWEAWLSSSDKWLNRTCLLYQLKYKDGLDEDALEVAISRLCHHDEFFIQKAIGWALRQHSKIDPGWVVNMVDRYQLQGIARQEALKYVK